MTPEQILGFLGFSVVMAGTPGPSNALLTATGAKVGVARGVPALVGVAAGMGALMFVVAFGLGSVILGIPLLVTAVKWIGAAVLCWLAWKIATSGASSGDHVVRPIGFFGAAAFQVINPKSWLAATSGATAFLDPGRGTALSQAATFALVFLAASLPCCFVWLAFGAVLQRAFRSERALRIFNVAMGILLVGCVVWLVLD